MLFTLMKLWTNWQQRKEALKAAERAADDGENVHEDAPAPEDGKDEETPRQ